MLHVAYAGKTNSGLRRPNNEDALVVEAALGLLVVADGMGGAASGEVASRIFAEASREVFAGVETTSDELVSEAVRNAFAQANQRIFSIASANREHKGMGCTAELFAYFQGNYILGHVGDSRTYLFRDGELKQITRDHSLIQEQIDQGIISPLQARTHALKNVIVRAVGVSDSLAVDLVKGSVQKGDLFLLCSDGLTDMLLDNEIEELLSGNMNLDDRAVQLIEAANSAGGYDNVTVALCQVT